MSWEIGRTIFRVSWYFTAIRYFIHNFILIVILFSFNIDRVEERTLLSITIVNTIIIILIFLSYIDWSLSWDSNTQNITFGGWCCGWYIRLTFITTFITQQRVIFKSSLDAIKLCSFLNFFIDKAIHRFTAQGS